MTAFQVSKDMGMEFTIKNAYNKKKKNKKNKK